MMAEYLGSGAFLVYALPFAFHVHAQHTYLLQHMHTDSPTYLHTPTNACKIVRKHKSHSYIQVYLNITRFRILTQCVLKSVALDTFHCLILSF